MFHEPRFWTSLAFILFFMIFGRKLWSVITEKLDARANLIKSHLDEATRLRREAEQMLEDATREKENAQTEANQLIAASEAEAAALREKTARDAAAATAHHEKLARERIQIAEQAALREIHEKAIILAIAATREFITEKLAQEPGLANNLIEHGLNSLPEALRNKAA